MNSCPVQKERGRRESRRLSARHSGTGRVLRVDESADFRAFSARVYLDYGLFLRVLSSGALLTPD